MCCGRATMTATPTATLPSTMTATMMLSGVVPRVVTVVARSSLLRAVLRARLPIGRSCRGVGQCGACRVFVVAGTCEPMDTVEAELAKRMPLGDGERFACRARMASDVTLTTGYW